MCPLCRVAAVLTGGEHSRCSSRNLIWRNPAAPAMRGFFFPRPTAFQKDNGVSALFQIHDVFRLGVCLWVDDCQTGTDQRGIKLPGIKKDHVTIICHEIPC